MPWFFLCLALFLSPVALATELEQDECARALAQQFALRRHQIERNELYSDLPASHKDEAARRAAYKDWLMELTAETFLLKSVVELGRGNYTSLLNGKPTNARRREILLTLLDLQLSLIATRLNLFVVAGSYDLHLSMTHLFSSKAVDESFEVDAETMRGAFDLARQSMAYLDHDLAATIDQEQDLLAVHFPHAHRHQQSTSSVAMEQAELLLEEGTLPSRFLDEVRRFYRFFKRYRITPSLEYKKFVHAMRMLKIELARED